MIGGIKKERMSGQELLSESFYAQRLLLTPLVRKGIKRFVGREYGIINEDEVSLGKKAETSIQLKGVSITRKEK